MAEGEIKIDITTALKGMSSLEVAEALSKSMESSRRRDLVGGLIRYLKDGENDLGRLLFHYVHVDDYGQAMVEGWGEFHSIIESLRLKSAPLGALGLPYTEVGELAQAIGACIVDREEYSKEEVVNAIARIDFDESYWWDARGADIVNDFESWLELPPRKEEV